MSHSIFHATLDRKMNTMKFAIIWTVSPENRNAVQERFMETGGLPPEGVEMIHRFHAADGSMGLAICNATEGSALANWSQEWSDLIDLDITPIVSDEEMASILDAQSA